MTWDVTNNVLTAHKFHVRTEVQIPGSKSDTHRAYVAACLSAPVTIRNPLRAADPNATLASLSKLGMTWESVGTDIKVKSFAPKPYPTNLNLENAGTGLRLTMGLAASLNFPVAFDGDDSLRSRTNAPLIDALRNMGVIVNGGPCVPLSINGPATNFDVHVSGSISSQFTSALLILVAASGHAGSVTVSAPIRSKKYVEMTANTLNEIGFAVSSSETADGIVWDIPIRGFRRASTLTVEGDWSTASFHIVAGALDSGVTIHGLNPDSLQADRAILEILFQFAIDFYWESSALVIPGGQLPRNPESIDVSQCPDLFPVLTVLAAHGEGQTQFVGGQSLRHKETDRIKAMHRAFSGVGIRAVENPHGLTVSGGPIQGGNIAAQHDHRIHMACGILGLRSASPIVVDSASSVAVSHPNYHQELATQEARP